MQEHLIALQLLQLLPLLSLVFQLGWPMLMTSYTWSQREVSLSLSETGISALDTEFALSIKNTTIFETKLANKFNILR